MLCIFTYRILGQWCHRYFYSWCRRVRLDLVSLHIYLFILYLILIVGTLRNLHHLLWYLLYPPFVGICLCWNWLSSSSDLRALVRFVIREYWLMGNLLVKYFLLKHHIIFDNYFLLFVINFLYYFLNFILFHLNLPNQWIDLQILTFLTRRVYFLFLVKNFVLMHLIFI